MFTSLLFVYALAVATSLTPSQGELTEALGKNIDRIPELRYLRREAERLGIRVWLFGGTASAYGHYVNWDLRRARGDAKYLSQRFNYDFINVFRYGQDLDIVVDGPIEKMAEFEALIQKEFPYFKGNRNSWEVRHLRKSSGIKGALLDDWNFANQHTDSNSTGLIEVTTPETGRPLVRDLRDWDSDLPKFFEDIRNGELHYYFSGRHKETERYLAGMNPPIFSVIRYLTKAFQYELKITNEDKQAIRRIIDEFYASQQITTSYAAEWLEKNGKKLVLHAANMEYAFNTMKELGLLERLQKAGSAKTVGSMAWWLSREPLRSGPIGQGGGKTARELKINEVAHETNDYSAYESIIRSAKGEPNVLISRGGIVGEAAVHGNGFYTRAGRQGARGTGMTIRFKLDPDAREGTDFKRVGSDGFVLVLNRNAIRVVPESLEFTPLSFFQMLESFQADDLGLVERLKRSVSGRLKFMETDERNEIIRSFIALTKKKKSPHFMVEATNLIENLNLSFNELQRIFSEGEKKSPFLDRLRKQFILKSETPQQWIDAASKSRPPYARMIWYEAVEESLLHLKELSPTHDQLSALDRFLAEDNENPLSRRIRWSLSDPQRFPSAYTDAASKEKSRAHRSQLWRDGFHARCVKSLRWMAYGTAGVAAAAVASYFIYQALPESEPSDVNKLYEKKRMALDESDREILDFFWEADTSGRAYTTKYDVNRSLENLEKFKKEIPEGERTVRFRATIERLKQLFPDSSDSLLSYLLFTLAAHPDAYRAKIEDLKLAMKIAGPRSSETLVRPDASDLSKVIGRVRFSDPKSIEVLKFLKSIQKFIPENDREWSRWDEVYFLGDVLKEVMTLPESEREKFSSAMQVSLDKNGLKQSSRSALARAIDLMKEAKSAEEIQNKYGPLIRYASGKMSVVSTESLDWARKQLWRENLPQFFEKHEFTFRIARDLSLTTDQAKGLADSLADEKDLETVLAKLLPAIRHVAKHSAENEPILLKARELSSRKDVADYVTRHDFASAYATGSSFALGKESVKEFADFVADKPNGILLISIHRRSIQEFNRYQKSEPKDISVVRDFAKKIMESPNPEATLQLFTNAQDRANLAASKGGLGLDPVAALEYALKQLK